MNKNKITIDVDDDILNLVEISSSEKLLENDEVIIKINSAIKTTEIKKRVDELALMILNLIPRKLDL